MSRYAFDQERYALSVSWGVGIGDVVSTVAILEATVPAEQILRLAQELTDLSATVWRTYIHPASAAESLEVNTEGWRRQGDRDAFAAMPKALVHPNLPDDHGSLTVSYIPTEEAAHRVGRVLHGIGDETLTGRVAEEVAAELAAVEQAELGELSGRARQAVTLTRAGASPTQVEAADRLLYDQPLGTRKLFSEVDPTAAAVAAAHWLYAAAEVCSDESGLPVTEVVIEADNIAALPHETPTLILEGMTGGLSPYEAVTGMVRDAIAAAEGEIPNIESIPERIKAAEETAGRRGRDDPRFRDELVRSIRATPLDPSRPAQDLLEDLLAGIGGCWMLYREYADSSADDFDSDDDIDEFLDDEEAQAETEQMLEEFIELVRLEAAGQKDRLL